MNPKDRRDLTPDQRRARPPWLDYDVPEAQQIVRFGTGRPQMSTGGAQPPKPAPTRSVDPLGYYSQLDEVLRGFKPTD